MHLKQLIDFTDFLRTVSTCKDDVFFCTEQGDKLNLKSDLSRYVFTILALKSEIFSCGFITCAHENDYDTLNEFLIE